jgi:hypothetical protein
MSWRKYIVRAVVYGISSSCVLGAVLYQRWTNPDAVREQIIAKLSAIFPEAQVSVDSARLRILGGIQLNGLRLMRADDPEKIEFLFVPSAIFYHDKEKILDGELALRKIELIRPRLRVRREKDGSWNLKNLYRQPEGARQIPIPAIVIHQGTLIFEDRADAKASTLEINDISLTIVNDPLPVVIVRGAANSDLLGKLQLKGQLQRLDDEAYLSFTASNIPLTQTLIARLPTQCPSHMLAGLEVSATAGVQGQLSYHPKHKQPLYYDVHCQVQGGIVKHPHLPFEKVENLQLNLHCTNGELRLEKATARAGETEIAAQGFAQLPCADQEFEVELDLKHVKLGTDLAGRLPEKLRNLHEMFKPDGPTTIHIACARHANEWVTLSSGIPSQVSLRPEEISMQFVGFPYPLHKVKGTVDYNILDKHVKVDLVATAADQAVKLNGHWNGEGTQADVNFNFEVDDIPIDDTLVHALPASLQKFVESFHANGKLRRVTSNIRHEPGKDFCSEFHITIGDEEGKTAICWDNFPYTLKGVKGTIDIYPDHWEFRNFEGWHNNGHVMLNGQSTPKGEKGEHGISLEIKGDDISLGDDLRDALRPMPGLHKSWETFGPQGNLYFVAAVNRPSSDPYDLEVRIEARGCDVRPSFFPYRIQEVQGLFHFHHNRLEIANLRARHDQALIGLDRGTVDLHLRGGGYYADFVDLQVQGMRLDDEFIQAIPRSNSKIQDAARALHLHDPLRIKTRLVIAQPPETGMPPDVFWDAEVKLFEAKMTAGLEFNKVTGTFACRGRHNGRQIVGVSGNLLLDQATLYNLPFKNIHANFQIQKTAPDVLLIGLHAPNFGGDVTGQVRVDFNSTLGYKVNLTASQIKVAEVAQHLIGPKSELTGTASARLYLAGLGTGMDSLEGNGAIDIPQGHLYNLPFLFDLLKFLGLHWPDRTAFEEFHTDFAIQGSKVSLQHFDLFGSAVSLSGKGEHDLQSKKIELDVYPMWGRIEQLLPPNIRPFPTTVSKNLFTVEVRGKLGGDAKDLQFHMKPMPIIVDPLLLLRERMLGQQPAPTIGAARP